jgi:hypothetical protein
MMLFFVYACGGFLFFVYACGGFLFFVYACGGFLFFVLCFLFFVYACGGFLFFVFCFLSLFASSAISGGAFDGFLAKSGFVKRLRSRALRAILPCLRWRLQGLP